MFASFIKPALTAAAPVAAQGGRYALVYGGRAVAGLATATASYIVGGMTVNLLNRGSEKLVETITDQLHTRSVRKERRDAVRAEHRAAAKAAYARRWNAYVAEEIDRRVAAGELARVAPMASEYEDVDTQKPYAPAAA
jgi:hypothetical protein